MTQARLVVPSRFALLPALLLGVAIACEVRPREPVPPASSARAAVAPRSAGTGGSGPVLSSLASLVEDVKGTVVNVDVQARAPDAPGGPEHLLEHFFSAPGGVGGSGTPEHVQRGEGAGFIIDPDGLILTNHHVVENALSIRVRLDDGRQYEARVLGRDPLTDVALLKLQGDVKNLPVARLGDSDAVRVGDAVVAIGSPFGLTSSVSAGILSARARDIQAGPYDNFLQTDAAINPGNSGGPLFNVQGEVIGINTAIVGGGAGIGFAVPSNMAQALLPQLREGRIRRGWLGVSVQDLTPDLARALHVPMHQGAIVTEVREGTPSARAGLKQDDILTAINGVAIESSRGLTRDVGFRQPGETVKLTVYRKGKPREVRARLAERPDLEGSVLEAPEGMREEHGGRHLGLHLQEIDFRRGAGLEDGALLIGVEPGSPADRADLQPGMRVVEAGGEPVHGPGELTRVLERQKSGAMLLLRVQVGDSRLLRALAIPTAKRAGP